MLPICLFLMLNFQILVQAFEHNFAKVEKMYYNEIIKGKQWHKNILCDLNGFQQANICALLFRFPRLRFSYKIRLSRLAYYYKVPQCIDQKITFFKWIPIKEWSQRILPCFGEHIPIRRTSWLEDEYHNTFFVSNGNTADILYLFIRERTGNSDIIRVMDRLELQVDLSKIRPIQHYPNEFATEGFLGTAVTHNTFIHEIETVYVLDFIKNSTPFADPLHLLDAGTLLTVCLSIFTHPIFAQIGYSVDREQMLTKGSLIRQNRIAFQKETDKSEHIRTTFLCLGRSDESRKKSIRASEKFRLASGRRNNSIFVFQVLGHEKYVTPLLYVENFDFDQLRPSTLREIEIYENFEPTQTETETTIQPMDISTTV